MQLKQLEKILVQKDLKLEASPGAVEELAREGYDPSYGARPLKRLIQKKIQDPMALMLLDGRILPGDTIYLDFDKTTGELAFQTPVHAN